MRSTPRDSARDRRPADPAGTVTAGPAGAAGGVPVAAAGGADASMEAGAGPGAPPVARDLDARAGHDPGGRTPARRDPFAGAPPVLPAPEGPVFERYRSGLVLLVFSVAAMLLAFAMAYGHYLFGQAPHRLVKAVAGAVVAALFLLRPDWSLVLLPFVFPYVEWLPKSPIPLVNAMNIVMGSLLAGWFARTFARRTPFFAPSPWNLLLPVFLLWAFFSWLRGSLLYGGSLTGSIYLLQNFWNGMSGLVLFFLVYNSVTTWKQVRRLAFLFCIASAAGFLGVFREYREFEGVRRVGGGLGQENIAGAFFAMGTLFTMAMLDGYRGFFRRGGLAGSLLASTFALVVPASRGAFIGFAGGALLQAVRNGIAWVLILGALVGGFVLWAPDYVMERMSTTQEAVTTTGDRYEALNRDGGGRLDFWKGSLKVIAANPVLGVGYGRIAVALEPYIGRARPSHNLYLETAGELGIPGLLLLLLIMGVAFREAGRLRSVPGFPRALGSGYQAALLSLALSSIFGGRLFTFPMAGTVSFLTALVFRARVLVREEGSAGAAGGSA